MKGIKLRKVNKYLEYLTYTKTILNTLGINIYWYFFIRIISTIMLWLETMNWLLTNQVCGASLWRVLLSSKVKGGSRRFCFLMVLQTGISTLQPMPRLCYLWTGCGALQRQRTAEVLWGWVKVSADFNSAAGDREWVQEKLIWWRMAGPGKGWLQRDCSMMVGPITGHIPIVYRRQQERPSLDIEWE